VTSSLVVFAAESNMLAVLRGVGVLSFLQINNYITTEQY